MEFSEIDIKEAIKKIDQNPTLRRTRFKDFHTKRTLFVISILLNSLKIKFN